MTARPVPVTRRRQGLRIIPGRGRPRPKIGTWVLFSVLSVLLFFILIASRVALDRPALELHDLQAKIEQEQTKYQRLRLEVAKLQSPERIVPLAEAMGLGYPSDVRVVVADGVDAPGPATEQRWADVKSILTAAP